MATDDLTGHTFGNGDDCSDNQTESPISSADINMQAVIGVSDALRLHSGYVRVQGK
jgi:hypothetical protein